MCGINGFYSKSSSGFNDVIEKMNSEISHRGPDNNGIWKDSDAGIFFGHQRLSILDLSSAGSQPMHSSSGRYIITYNGEVYNHIEVRKELEKLNNKIVWQGNSDTETLLEAIDYWGIEVSLQKINGMFAFGVWDKKARCLILARDRMGEKPLYYGWQGRGNRRAFLFGSELKALKVHPDFIGEINRSAISLQLENNYIPAPYSIYKDIYKLLPGHYLTLKADDFINYLLPSSKAYWSLTESAIYGNDNPLMYEKETIQKYLEKYLRSSVKKQMISDVPLGAFLSGGIDSSIIVSMMQSQSSNPVKTFTIGFSENNFSEAPYAKKVAMHLGTDHTELYVSPKETMEVIPNLPNIYDEPFSDPSQIPTYLVSKLAKKYVKVALSGDGGDELFCGYKRYVMSKKFWNILKYMPIPLRRILSSGIGLVSPQDWTKISNLVPSLHQYENFGDKIYKGKNLLDAESINDLYSKLNSHWQNTTGLVINTTKPVTLMTKYEENFRGLDSQQQMMALDSITYLPDDILVKVDRAAMASSLETRVPFLDHELIEYIWKIPQSLKIKNARGKLILKKILNQYIPSELTERPKMGFGIPIETWLRGPLRDWAENLLNEKRLTHEGYFHTKIVRDKWEEHLSGKRNWKSELWGVLMFQSWIDANN